MSKKLWALKKDIELLEQQLSDCKAENERLNKNVQHLSLGLIIAKDYMRKSFMDGTRILMHELHDYRLAELNNQQDKN